MSLDDLDAWSGRSGNWFGNRSELWGSRALDEGKPHLVQRTNPAPMQYGFETPFAQCIFLLNDLAA